STYSWFAEIIVIGILAIFLYLRKKNMGKLGISLSKKQYLILYVVVLISMTMASGMNYYVSIIHEQKEAALIGMITATASVVLIILAVYQVILAQNYQLLKENFRLQKQFHTMQEIYFENIAEQSNQTKKFQHDIKAHLQSIWQLALNNNDKEIIEYIDKIQQHAHFDKKYYFTGNQIIDILLAEVVQKAQENHISVKIDGVLPNDLSLDLVDLTTICYNLLQNALEATIRGNYDAFSVKFFIKNQQFMFIVKNRVLENIKIESGLIKTKKVDLQNHGLGLKNVYDAVERSNGLFEIHVKENQFIAKVLLPCN
ncbi:sensor histidine kinase, partial [Enterococcus cecorum]